MWRYLQEAYFIVNNIIVQGIWYATENYIEMNNELKLLYLKKKKITTQQQQLEG